MKLALARLVPCEVTVAPRAGAWIETYSSLGSAYIGKEVAPRAGAWIETSVFATFVLAAMSPPARGRGLKQQAIDADKQGKRRPPRGGVD